jgi:putative transposase
MSTDFYAPLEADNFFHIYNRGNDGIRIFYNEENYSYFLWKFDEYMSKFISVYSYCLLTNHFHFLIKVKSEENVLKAAKEQNNYRRIIDKAIKEKEDVVAAIVSEQFRRFFMAYSKAVNNQADRHGSLFTKRFRRIAIKDENYLKRVVFYIYNNPVHHKVSEKLENYKWSTYPKILSAKKTLLMKNEVIEWFGGKENYIYMHKSGFDTEDISEIED